MNKNASHTSVSITEILALLWGLRKKLAISTLVIGMITLLITLLIPNSYRSTAILMPESDPAGISSLTGLSGFASLAGITLKSGVLQEIYPTAIESEAVLKDVIYSEYGTPTNPHGMNLIEYWDISNDDSLEDYEEALKNLRDALQVSLDQKTGILEVSIVTRYPHLSAAIISNVVKNLDDFLQKKRRTNASEQRIWIETRLAEVAEELASSEERLRVFREKNRRIGDSPQLLLQQTRLLRDVELNATLFMELKKQYEFSRIDEVKTTAIINVLDQPREAGKKDGPKRSVIVAAIMALWMCGFVFFVLVKRRHADLLSLLIVNLREETRMKDGDPTRKV